MENRAIDMNEDWVKWNPIDLPDGEYFVTKFIQDADGTIIMLDDEKNYVEIFFDGIPTMVRSSIVGLRMRTWGEVQIKYQNKSFFKNWFLYVVSNSKLVNWAIEESCGFYEAYQFKHYCIVTLEEVIDILSTFEPEISVSHI